MLTKIIAAFSFLPLFLFACGDGLDEGPGLEVEEFLLALEGTWVGTTDEPHTLSGSDRVVMHLELPEDGEPRLDGLSGTIRFGQDVEPHEPDPDDPGIEGDHYMKILDGFSFTLFDIGLVSNRLLAGFQQMEQWSPFCEAQTELYEDNGSYFCTPMGPGWWGEGTGDGYMRFYGPEGQEVLMHESKVEICMYVCLCNAEGCSANLEAHGMGLDFAVDINAGVMMGTGGGGRIEAFKQ